jgi:phosphoribosylanthranilate isomerase
MVTRVKICGLTRRSDVEAAIDCGASALGFVCYERSTRFVSVETLAHLTAGLPPFVVPVLLFVNASEAAIKERLHILPDALLQFHGDESPDECARSGRAYVRAISMDDEVRLLDCERRFSEARALLADTPSAGYGGSGRSFDWARIPAVRERGKPLVLAGGLNEGNVEAAVLAVRPFAVDVSSGVEEAPGVKNAARMARFVAAVRRADAQIAAAESV